MAIGSVLFSAGEGRRLRPLTHAVAKPALPILDVPLGAFGLPDLAAEAPPVVVNVSHLADTVIEALHAYLPDIPWLAFTEEPKGFGTAGTLAALADEVLDPVVVRNGDAFTDLTTAEVMTTHVRSGAQITLAVQEVTRGADLQVDGGRAVEFIDRRVEPDAPGTRYIGMAVLARDVVTAIPDRRPLGLGEAVFKPLVDAGEVAVHLHSGSFVDVGTVARYLDAGRMALDGHGPKPPRGWPGDFAPGSSYVGPGAEVASGTLGERAIVLRGGRVEPGAFVERSIVWPNEIVPSGTQIKDCVWFGGRALTPETSR